MYQVVLYDGKHAAPEAASMASLEEVEPAAVHAAAMSEDIPCPSPTQDTLELIVDFVTKVCTTAFSPEPACAVFQLL